MGLYAVFLKDGDCGDIRYGRRYYDYQDGTVVFLAPGQVVGGDNGDEEFNPQGRAIMFHPDLLYGTHLGKHIGEYTFFSYQTNEALHISEEEKAIFIDCLEKTKSELRRSVDRHTNMIIASAIELLLNYCSRFYDRQFITRVKKNSDVLTRFESLLHDYFERGDAREQGLP